LCFGFGGKDTQFSPNKKQFPDIFSNLLLFVPIRLIRVRFFVPLAPAKVLSFDNKNEKRLFILYCAHLIVPLHPK